MDTIGIYVAMGVLVLILGLTYWLYLSFQKKAVEVENKFADLYQIYQAQSEIVIQLEERCRTQGEVVVRLEEALKSSIKLAEKSSSMDEKGIKALEFLAPIRDVLACGVGVGVAAIPGVGPAMAIPAAGAAELLVKAAIPKKKK